MPYKDPEQQKAYQREWVAARRKLWFKNKVCTFCGEDDYSKLELDHIDPTLKLSHRIWSWSWKRIAEETAKCQVLCHKCHVEKTNEEDRPGYVGVVHGTQNTYDYYGCRCDECRRAHNDKVNAWRYRTGKRKTPSNWSPHFGRMKVSLKEMVDITENV